MTNERYFNIILTDLSCDNYFRKTVSLKNLEMIISYEKHKNVKLIFEIEEIINNENQRTN